MSLNSLPRTLAAPIVFALIAVAGVASPRAHAQAAANTVTIKNYDFSPMKLTVVRGASVTWKNLDEEPHTVTSTDGLFRSGALDGGDSFKFKFDKPGAYSYLCSIHSKMRAVIIVK